MVRVTDEVSLVPEEVNLYFATDSHLANLPVFVFHGPSTTTNSTLNSSRIQVHVFTAAGFQSYPRVTISPNSPFYQSVNHLPRDRQGDEICRGLAFGLLKYFKELPEVVKSGLILQSANARPRRPGSAPTLFGEQHAADLAGSMVKVENIGDIIQDIEAALRPQNINHVDVDFVLPPGSIAAPVESQDTYIEDADDFSDPTPKQYGLYAPLVRLFGEVSFLPTSKLRRAPSKPTALNRSRSLLKDQKLSLRREMGELVDTEERYVIKMHELVNYMADEFRAKAKSRPAGSFSPSEEDLRRLFPACLDKILQVNSGFLADIRKVMDNTEEEAMQDLEAPTGSTSSRHGGGGRLRDPTGALAFAQVLLEWFPKFSECYQEYIRASQDFPQIISSFMKQQSSFSQRVQQTGEQRLRSAVIEPVQRLPRYSLFIDNIANFLPVNHPALLAILKARDIITTICSLDPPSTEKSQAVQRLRLLIESWPPSLHPEGRIISAIDFVEPLAPFHTPSATSSPIREGVLLLFGDSVIILKKIRDGGLSARGLVAEVDKPSAATMMATMTASASGQKHVHELVFAGWHPLADTRFTMTEDGSAVFMVSLQEIKNPGAGRDRTGQSATIRNFVLRGGYEMKAAKLTEEIARARIEGRFSESERETDKWCLRSIKPNPHSVHLHTAVFEEGIDTLKEGRREPAPIRIIVDREKGTKGAPVGHYGVEIVANITTMAGGLKYMLEVDGLSDRVYMDEVGPDTLLPTLTKRLNDLIAAHYRSSNPLLTSPLLSFFCKILKSMQIIIEGDKNKTFRPGSPVKMLSNFLNFSNSTTPLHGSLSGRSTPKLIKTPQMSEVSTFEPMVSRNNSQKSMVSTQEPDGKSSVWREEERPINPLVRLEETFTGYVAALQARKGNIIGRLLRNRGAADELSINAIYNTFIENPFDQRTASEVTADVLFVAFEKYLRMAWKDQMGHVMPLQTLNALQERAVKAFPGEFADYVRNILSEMAPQNRRAFIAIIKLLADLLDGCGNDGDRGALTVAFAELLIIEGEPHDYINLLDRMVEDQDRLFDDIGPGAVTGFGSAYGSMNGNRSNPSATGSLTSNASSLRKRFTETLLRQNSARDDRPSVWRSLSKTSRNPAPIESNPSSLSKGSSSNRSRSIESPSRRPGSRDRPTVLGAFDDRPTSSSGLMSRLSTIGGSPPTEKRGNEKSLKKKRRSSLSDLKSLMAGTTLGSPSPFIASPGGCGAMFPSPNPSSPKNMSPKTPTATKIPIPGSIMNRDRGVIYASSPLPKENGKEKENIPFNLSGPRNTGGLAERPVNIPPNPDIVVIKDLWDTSATPKGHLKSASLASGIPTLHGHPTLRPTTSSGRSAPQKLRLQSPQKLRERLQNEAKAINEAEASLQNELSKIGEEMAKLTASSHFGTAKSAGIASVVESMKVLENKIPAVVKDMTARNEAIKLDLEKSLQASEFKVRGLDQLYKEGVAENELLYEKFNAELGKIVLALKGKAEKEELIKKLKDSSEETAWVKKENARLKRELLTLRGVLKAHES